MTPAARTLDRRVAIDHVHVRTTARPSLHRRPIAITGYITGPAGSPLHDERITIHQLCIDVEAALDLAAARVLGHALAHTLADQLAALQHDPRPARGPIHVESLRVHLWGDPARYPTHREISDAALTALLAEVHHG